MNQIDEFVAAIGIAMTGQVKVLNPAIAQKMVETCSVKRLEQPTSSSLSAWMVIEFPEYSRFEQPPTSDRVSDRVFA